MISSIRSFLLASILSSVVVILLLAIAVNYALTQKGFRKHLDEQLVFVGTAVSEFIETNQNIIDQKKLNSFLRTLSSPLSQNGNKNQVPYYYFQIINASGKVIATNDASLARPISNKLGLSDAGGSKVFWRVFSVYVPKARSTILIAQKNSVRTQLGWQLGKWPFIILIFFIPVLTIMLWLVIRVLLLDVKRVNTEMAKDVPGNLHLIDVQRVPKEIKPLVSTINNLFSSFGTLMKQEREFAEDAAHELQTPLAAITTNAQIALDICSDKEVKKILQSILRSADRSTHGISQLLILSRMLSNVYSAKSEDVDLNSEIAVVLAEFTPFAQSKDISIEFFTNTKEHQFLYGNSYAVKVLLENLIDNAIRYTPHTGMVRVSVEKDNASVIIRVIDSGAGIPEALREKVFNRFYRVVGNKEMGSGLGLSIVRQIAKIYDAEISLKTPLSGIGLESVVIFNNC
jgi:two-component system, OmpR family, sensor histidine kinase QseC